MNTGGSHVKGIDLKGRNIEHVEEERTGALYKAWSKRGCIRGDKKFLSSLLKCLTSVHDSSRGVHEGSRTRQEKGASSCSSTMVHVACDGTCCPRIEDCAGGAAFSALHTCAFNALDTCASAPLCPVLVILLLISVIPECSTSSFSLSSSRNFSSCCAAVILHGYSFTEHSAMCLRAELCRWGTNMGA